MIALLVTGCATSQPESFVLAQGETMECFKYSQTECGMQLEGCGADHSIEFGCLKGIQYVGPKPTEEKINE